MRFYTYFLPLICMVLASPAFGQSIGGSWQGSMAPVDNVGQTVHCTATLRVVGEILTGNLIVQANTTTDSYTLQGRVQGNQATGTATYPADGSVFQVEAAIQQGQLLLAVGQNGKALMRGQLSKTTAKSGQPAPTDPRPSATAKPAGLYRDPALVGAWQTTANYGGGLTDGGFYGSTSSIMLLNADGSFGDGGSAGYASGSGVSVQSSGGTTANSAIARLNAMGARWYTKGNVIYVRVRANGQQQDVPTSTYYVENGRMLLTDPKTGKKTLYTRP